MEIIFEPEKLIQKINQIQRVQVPKASAIALNRGVFEGSQELQRRAQNGGFSNPVPFTVKSFLYQKTIRTGSDMQARIFIRDNAPKGNAPADYLAPQLKGPMGSGGRYYPTRFQGALLNTVVQNATGRNVQVGQRGQIMLANLRSPKTRTNKYGNMTPGQYTQILSALRGNISSADIYGSRQRGEAPVSDQSLSKYIYLDEESINEPYFRRRLTNSPKPGIYFVNRLKSGTKYYRVMTQTRLPTYQGKFPFYDIALLTAKTEFEKSFSQQASKFFG